MTELFTEFAFEILLLVVLGTGGSLMAYFKHLQKKIALSDARTLRLSVAFLHFVRRNDELHSKSREVRNLEKIISPEISLGDEIENLLKDPKTDKL